jgi:hypothetical protein
MTIDIFADTAARLNIVVARTEEEASQLERNNSGGNSDAKAA